MAGEVERDDMDDGGLRRDVEGRAMNGGRRVQVKLLEIDHKMAAAMERGAGEFEARFRVSLGESSEVAGVVISQIRGMVEADPRDRPWGGYLAIDPLTAKVVGTCAFKARPAEEGSVEIAYFTFPPFEGKGYGTAMALRLIEMAESSRKVGRILAHTLPERSGSTRILEKAGMSLIGEVIDPEDGLVWRWARDLEGAGSGKPRPP